MSASSAVGGGRTLRIHGTSYPVLLPSRSDPRLHLATTFVFLHLIGQLAFDFRVSLVQIFTTLLTCAVLEVGVVFWRQRMIIWPASALLTGNGIAFILRVPGTRHGDWWSTRGLWIYVACAIVSLLSKYLIQFRGRHVFNPSNFGLVLCFLVLGSGRTEPLEFWWGPTSVWLVLALGIIVTGALAILSRLHLLGVAVGFWLTFAAALGVLAASGHAMSANWHLGPVSDSYFWRVLVTSPEVFIFLSFMITDPRTVPQSRTARRVYAVSIGLLGALLIAPQRTEFGAKVGLLGALTIVCAAGPLVVLLRSAVGRSSRSSVWERATRFVVDVRGAPRATVGAVALLGAVSFAGVIVLAGIPARSSAAVVSAPITGALPEVTVVHATGVAPIDKTAAHRIARDIVADLDARSDSFRQRDPALAAVGGTGAWLASLQRKIHAAAGRPITVPTHHIQRVALTLEPSRSQAQPTVIAAVDGTVQVSTYAGTPPVAQHTTDSSAYHETLELALHGNRFVIVASRGAIPRVETDATMQTARLISVKLRPLRGASAPQGRPFLMQVVVRNQDAASLAVKLGLRLVAPDGTEVPFFQGTLVVTGKGQTVRRASVTSSQWFASLGAFSVAVTANGRPSGAPLVFDVTAPTVSVPVFEDVTRRVGLETTVPAPACGQFLNGAAWADLNGDDLPDLFLTRLGKPAQLFIDDGHGHFRDQADVWGVAVTDATGAAFADYDNDGRPDLFVTRDRGGDILFHNDGDGHFANVTTAAGIASAAPGTSVAWGDYNDDGHLDVYVASYVRCVGKWKTPYTLTSKVRYYSDKLYRNNGDGTFTDVTALLGSGTTRGAGFAAAWFHNGDGNRPDLYLGNDFIGQSPDHNHLWRNETTASGATKFADASDVSGTAFFMNTMGIGIGDFERDGRLDLALSNIGSNKLLHNNGDGSFTDVAAAAGVARPLQRATSPSVTWGVGAFDFNLDGWEDLYLAAGNVLQGLDKKNGPQPNELFVNDGTGKRFLDLSAPSGAADPADSKGTAFADYDRDGRVDIFVVDQGGAPRLYRNVTPRGRNHWLEVVAAGTVSNRDGCGARIVLTLENGSRLTREALCAGSDKAVHFGLGQSVRPSRLDVTWPSGIHQELLSPGVDRTLTVEEPARSS